MLGVGQQVCGPNAQANEPKVKQVDQYSQFASMYQVTGFLCFIWVSVQNI